MAKSRTKTVSNEELITALLQANTIKAAAESLGISPRTIHTRMREPAFQEEYNAAKNAVLQEAVSTITAKLSTAVSIIAEIMENPDTNPATRLQAAQTILNNAGKLSDRLDNYSFIGF